MSSRARDSQVSSEGGVSEPVCEANQKDGGYDFETVEEVPTKFLCSICSKILHDPHLTGCCGKHFCATCLNKQEKQTCPLCKDQEEPFKHMLDKSIRGEIYKLKIYCTNRRAGCKWVGQLNTLQDHLVSDSGCQLDCPNKCGTTGIKRAEIDQHRSKCPLEPVECPFKEAGCQVKVVRKEFDSHMVKSQQQHLLTLMGAFRVAKADLEAIKVGIATDVKILRQSSEKEQSDLALASIESQLEMKSFRLKVNGPPLTIRMANFSHYKRSGKVWYSPPFYYGDGYKMQLAVYANGTGAGAGTHVSIVLLRMKGEYDDQLKWTNDSVEYNMHIKMKTQKTSSKLHPSADIVQYICRPNRISGAENVREEGRKEKLGDLQTLNQLLLLNDSIVLQVTLYIYHFYELDKAEK